MAPIIKAATRHVANTLFDVEVDGHVYSVSVENDVLDKLPPGQVKQVVRDIASEMAAGNHVGAGQAQPDLVD